MVDGLPRTRSRQLQRGVRPLDDDPDRRRDPMTKHRPEVSVVIPYFDDQARLNLLLRSLDQQQGTVGFEVVVADDGSAEPPIIPAGLRYHCAVVRQPDAGFRAAAARNLGAAAAVGEFLVFLDGDTFPTAGYLAAVTGTLRAIDNEHGALVVGRRRHAGSVGGP